MVEVHRTRRESPLAVCTGRIAQLVEEARVFLPADALSLEISRRSALEGLAGHAFDMRGTGAQSMAVRAHGTFVACWL